MKTEQITIMANCTEYKDKYRNFIMLGLESLPYTFVIGNNILLKTYYKPNKFKKLMLKWLLGIEHINKEEIYKIYPPKADYIIKTKQYENNN